VKEAVLDINRQKDKRKKGRVVKSMPVKTYMEVLARML
jgi:hypothetical protein